MQMYQLVFFASNNAFFMIIMNEIVTSLNKACLRNKEYNQIVT